MSDYSRFLLRMLNTDYKFTVESRSLKILLSNRESLRGITVALPKNKYRYQTPDPPAQKEPELYRYQGGYDYKREFAGEPPGQQAEPVREPSIERYHYQNRYDYNSVLTEQDAAPAENFAENSGAQAESAAPAENPGGETEGAVPAETAKAAPSRGNVLVAEDENYYYITVNDDSKERTFFADVIK
jgi:hypothetical protein